MEICLYRNSVTKKGGCIIRPHPDLPYGLNNNVISELLGQNTNTDPFPLSSSLIMPVCILCSIIRHNSYAYKSVETKLQKSTCTFRIQKLVKEYKLPDSRILSNQKDSSVTVPPLIQINKTESQRFKVYNTKFTDFPNSTNSHPLTLAKITSPTQLSCRRSGKFQQHSQVLNQK
jgi:hypothetical protein